MKKLNCFVFLMVSVAFWGCAFLSKPKHKEVLKPAKDVKAFRAPCINLPFIDEHFPEHLHELIGLYHPKVDPMGAYKVTVMLLNREKKRKHYAVDTKSAKLCKEKAEFGYAFKLVKVSN